MSFATLNQGFALPQSGSVAAGSAIISTASPNRMQINQSSQRAVINWQSYNLSPSDLVNYQQPNSSSIALNRISPAQGASQIYGRITANGRIILINPAGIYFGPGSYVNVGGLVATTSDIANKNFMAGNFRFVPTGGNGAIINDGIIKVAQAGLVALVGNGVVNNGYIEANLGTVVLASGNTFTVNFSGNDLISFAAGQEILKPAYDQNGNALRDGVRNSGIIYANGGKIAMTAQAASRVLDNAINLQGVAQADSIRIKNGEIILMANAGNISISGELSASGKNAGEQGGNIKIRADKIIVDQAKINVSGNSGGGMISIGGNAHGAGKSELNAKQVYVGPNAYLIADATKKGNGGEVIVWSDDATQFYGNIFARGGVEGGNGGWIETSGKEYLFAKGVVNASAPLGNPGEWLLDPRNVFLQTAATTGGTFNGGNPNTFTPTADDAVADIATIQTSLNGGTSVTITTGATGTQSGNITLVNPILKSAGGTATLTLTAAAGTGTINLNNTISSTLGALNVTLSGLLINLGADITSLGGNINFNSPVSLTANINLNLGTGNASFANTLNGANTLAINTSGNTTFSNTVGATTALTSLTTDAGGVTAINGGSVRTSGGQTYNDAVTLNANTTISSTGGSDITFNGTLNSASATARTLALNTTGITTLGGIVGGTFALSTLTTNAGGSTAINGGSVTTSAAGGQVYNDSVTLNADAVLNAAAGAINLAGTVNSFNSTARSLTLNTTGTTTLTGVVGGTNVLSSLITNAGGSTTINSTAITTSGAQTYNDAVTLATAAKALTSTAGTITFGSTLGGAFALTLSGNTGVTFNGTVATPASLDVTGPANINASVTTTSTQSWHGNVVLGANATLTTTNSAVVFDGTVDRDATARNLTVSAGSAPITFSGNIGAGVNGALGTLILNSTGATTLTGTIAASSLTTNANGTTAINGGSITTTGAQIYNDAVTLNANTILDAGTGAITFANTLNSANATARTLVLNTTGTTTFSGVVGGANALSGITTNAGGATAINGGTMTTSGAGGLVFNDAVTLNANTTLNAGAGAITFASTLDSLSATARTLALNTTGLITLSGAVGNTFALSTLTTSIGSTTAIDGGSIRTTGNQTYNGIVNILLNPLNIIVTTANTDIFFPNLANNITQAITFTPSGAGTFRDITLANNAATAVVPTLPTGLRNLILNFGSAGMVLPALTLTGALTATVGGGNMTQGGALTIGGTTTLNATGANDIILTNTANNFGSVVVNSAQNASLRDTNTINFGAGSSVVTGNLSVIAGTTITDTGSITAGTLTTNSGTGTTLDFGHNISNFNATNTTSGGITLVNTGGSPLTLTGISQGGSTVSITNNGIVIIPDGVTIGSGTTLAINATDLDMNTTGAIASGTTTTIAQTQANGSIGLGNTAGTMSISGSELQRISATGLTLTNGSNGAINVDGITAANTAGVSGAITLSATTGTLGTLSFINAPSSFRTLTANSDAGTTVGQNLSTIVGALSFTVNTGTLSVADGATASSNTTLAVSANDLNLNTSGALTATTTASIAQNIAGASIGLGNTAGTMSISGSELQRITATGLTLTNGSNGTILVDGITAANTASVSGAITLSAVTGTLGTISFINAPSIFRTLTATADAGITVAQNLSTSVGALNFTVNTGLLDVNNGATAFSNTTLAVTANDLNLNTSGALTSNGAMTITQNVATNSIGLGNTAGNMTISASELQRLTADSLSLVNSSNGSIIVDGISATDTANITNAITLNATTGTLGTISFINNPSSFKTLTVNSDAGTTVGQNLSTTVGALTFLVNTGTLSVLDGVTASGNTSLGISANDLNLNTTGALSSPAITIAQNVSGNSIGLGNSVGNMTISGSELQRMSGNTLTLTNANNGNILVDGITAVDSANIANGITLNATTGTTGGVTFQNTSSTFAHALTVSADQVVNINDGVTVATNNAPLTITASDLNMNTTGAFSSGTDDTIIEANTGTLGIGLAAGTMSISNSELQRMTAANLTLRGLPNITITVNGVALNDTANISDLVTIGSNAGNGTVTFANNASTFKSLDALAEDGIVVNAPITTMVGDMLIVSNTVGTVGAINLNADLTAAGSLTLNAPGGVQAGIVLGAPVLLTANNVFVNYQVDGAFGLTINPGVGSATIQGIVGGTTPLASLNITGNAILNGAAIITSGAQTYNNTTLGANTTMTSNSSGNIHLDGTVNGSFTLAINTAGETAFAGIVGGSTALTSITTDAPGIVALNGGAITTTGTQTYNEAATLGADTTITSSGVTFGNILNSSGSPRNLSLNAGSGNILFNNNVGNVMPLSTLTIVNVNDLTNNGLMQINSYNQLAGNLTSFGSSGINATSGAVIVANNVTGEVNVGTLALNTAAADLTGFVNGFAGQAGADLIVLLNTILPGTHFFDGIDLYKVTPPVPPNPPVPPEPDVVTPTASEIFGAYLSSVNEDNWIFRQLTEIIESEDNNRKCDHVSASIEICPQFKLWKPMTSEFKLTFDNQAAPSQRERGL